MSIVVHTISGFLKVALLASANVTLDPPQRALGVEQPIGAEASGSAAKGTNFMSLQQPIASVNELRRSSDGLFYLDAQVNGTAVRFLVDTGATTIVLTPSDARRSGVMPDAGAFAREANTAGGSTRFAMVKLDRLVAGPAAQYNVDAAVAGEGLQVSLLGVSWLSRLNGVSLEGDRMVLR